MQIQMPYEIGFAGWVLGDGNFFPLPLPPLPEYSELFVAEAPVAV